MPEHGGHGCWARIYIIENGFYYWAGFKWMGGGPTFDMKTPEQMAKRLNHVFLGRFIREVENGEVFKNMVELNR